MTVPTTLIDSGAQVLVAAITALATWALNELRKFLAAKTKTTLDEQAVAIASDIVTTVVLSLDQTMRPLLVDALADGKLSAEEGARLKKTAADRVKGLLGEVGWAKLKAALGLGDEGVSAWISDKIEANISVNKATKAAAENNTLPPFFMSQEMAKKVIAEKK